MNAKPSPPARTPRPERVLWVGHPSRWNWWLELTLCALLVLLSGALCWTRYARYSVIPACCAAFLYAAVAVKRRSRSFRITSQRVLERTSFFSKHSSEMEIADIRNINLVQSFIQRVLRIGDIQIASASNDKVDVHFAGIYDPESIKERIREARLSAPGGDHHAKPE
jgi:uncharacterized membrane protein YdbT with pleckstrin-like domain